MTPRESTKSRIVGLYGIADAGAAEDPVRLGAELLAGGCRLVQLRAKSWDDASVLRAGRELRRRCTEVGATFILNDRPDLAVAVNADGVHIGQTDGSLEDARSLLGPDRILGRSTHGLHQLEQALVGADYVAFGPVFDTPNLSRDKPIRSLEQLAQIAALLDGRAPLVAIGGIHERRLEQVIGAGADSWAVIGAIAGAEDRVAATSALLA
ncbi:MAG: thiamine phosphate synthase [Proteobacteria bacterium]|nr:thiamine phosphate synthase [Pseudomonadota bacterium]